MATKRIIPILQLLDGSLVKTTKYRSFKYIGDPVNTVRIFNELLVDEIVINDIRCSKNNSFPDIALLKEVAQECFVPLSYGGGIRDVETASKLYSAGFEKLIINTALFEVPSEIIEIINRFGSQAVVASLDIRRNIFSNPLVYKRSGSKKVSYNLDQAIAHIHTLGVGEVLINDIDREGTGSGLDKDLAEYVLGKTDLPVILNGGANDNNEIFNILSNTRLDAVGLGSMVVYQGINKGVLVNYSDEFRNYLWPCST